MSKDFEPTDFLFGPLEENEDDEDEDFVLGNDLEGLYNCL